MSEREQDESAIRKRLDDTRLALQQEREAASQPSLLATHVFLSSTKMKTVDRRTDTIAASGGGALARTADTRLPGMYARIEELSIDVLRTVAEQQTLRDLTPLNTRGKYHTRFMRDRYPIAGSQLKLENERALCIAAKKQLLFANNSLSAAGRGHETPTRATTPLQSSMRRSLSLGTHFSAAYRKLDYYFDKVSDVLRTEELEVAKARQARQLRLAEVQHEEGRRQFWTLFHSSHKR